MELFLYLHYGMVGVPGLEMSEDVSFLNLPGSFSVDFSHYSVSMMHVRAVPL